MNTSFFSPTKTRALSSFEPVRRSLPADVSEDVSLVPMKKKRNSSKKAEASFGSMGRVLFFSLALVIACCAVVVVLFETEAGQEFVAKVRGDVKDGNAARHGQDETKSRSSERDENKERNFAKKGPEAKREEPSKAEQESVTHGDESLGTGKDTSSNGAEDVNEERRTVEETSRSEGDDHSDESKVEEEDTREEMFMPDEEEAETSDEGESNDEGENGEAEGEKQDEEPAARDVAEDLKVDEEE